MPKNKIQQGMVDISHKSITKRTAVASATIVLSPEAFKIFLTKGSPKGDVLETAKIAAVMAAKKTPEMIPLCHPLELGKVGVNYDIDNKKCAVIFTVEVSYEGRTGVEMEALTAASVAVLTVYDMMKWADKSMVIRDVKLLKKTGGKSGDFIRSKA